MTEWSRPNQEWLAALRGPDCEQALADMRARLMRGLRYTLASRTDVTEADLEDFAQEALLRVLASLDTFRGESRFTTWAQKIAVRVAFTELRRRRWRDVSLRYLTDRHEGIDFTPPALTDQAPSPDTSVTQRMLVEILGRLIAEELTDRQRLALGAVVVCQACRVSRR